MYGGPYLPGFYEDCALDRRRQLSLMYLEALTTAAELSIAMNDVNGAIRLYRSVLDEGECADDAYYRLLQLLVNYQPLKWVASGFDVPPNVRGTPPALRLGRSSPT